MQQASNLTIMFGNYNYSDALPVKLDSYFLFFSRHLICLVSSHVISLLLSSLLSFVLFCSVLFCSVLFSFCCLISLIIISPTLCRSAFMRA